MGTALEDYLNLVARPEEGWNLFELSLQVCRIVDSRLDIDSCHGILVGITSAVADQLTPENNTYDVINTLNAVLFDELGFEGNESDYYNPENSYMSCVL